MGMKMPETCWAVFKRQAINLRICCIWFVDSVESMMIHGLINPKFITEFVWYCWRETDLAEEHELRRHYQLHFAKRAIFCRHCQQHCVRRLATRDGTFITTCHAIQRYGLPYKIQIFISRRWFMGSYPRELQPRLYKSSEFNETLYS
jgi:hypothetical protein